MDDDINNNWDLQAVVRSCRFYTPPPPSPPPPPPPPLLGLKDDRLEARGDVICFNSPTEPRSDLQELEELCKAFFPKTQREQETHKPSPSSAPSITSPRPNSLAPKSKRRKNQQKRVVCHVPADGVSSDTWAWRKYGQKPIKGSPYPRGYYKCSSLKGCLARKQVERSRTDPGMLVITYTAEHNHPMPTHRNSLAGSTRHKFPTPTSSASAAENPPPGNPTLAAGLSPTTPLTASMEEEEEDGMMLVEEMEVMGEDELLFVGSEGDKDRGEAESKAVLSSFFDGDGRLEEAFFNPPRTGQR